MVRVNFVVLAILIVGFAIPTESEREYWLLQQRLLLHADRCIRQLYNPSVLDVKYSESYTAYHYLGIFLIVRAD